MKDDKLILCKNSKCRVRLKCKRYIDLLHLAGTPEIKDYTIDFFEFDKCKLHENLNNVD